MHLLDYRPCGVCAAYVPATTGCGHWRARKGAGASRWNESDRARQRARRAQAKIEIEKLRASLTPGKAFP